MTRINIRRWVAGIEMVLILSSLLFLWLWPGFLVLIARDNPVLPWYLYLVLHLSAGASLVAAVFLVGMLFDRGPSGLAKTNSCWWTAIDVGAIVAIIAVFSTLSDSSSLREIFGIYVLGVPALIPYFHLRWEKRHFERQLRMPSATPDV